MNTLVLLATGRGPDVGRGGELLPTALSRVGGQTLLSRWIRHAAAIGVQRLVLVGGEQAELVFDHAGQDGQGLALSLVLHRSWKETGSAFELTLAAPHVSGDVLVADVRLVVDRRWVAGFSSPDALAVDVPFAGASQRALRVEGRRILAEGSRESTPTSMRLHEPLPLASFSRVSWARLVGLAERARSKSELYHDWLDHVVSLTQDGQLSLRPVRSPNERPWFLVDQEDDLLLAERYFEENPGASVAGRSSTTSRKPSF